MKRLIFDNMFKRLPLLFYLVFISNILTSAADRSERSFCRNFEIHFYYQTQGTLQLLEIEDKPIEIPEGPNQNYFQLAMSAINALRNEQYEQFDTARQKLHSLFPPGEVYDTTGYYHYLQYRHYFRLGEHRKAIEQLIYAKEIFKRRKLAAMTMDCLIRYYGSYSNSIFDTFPVEDFTFAEELIHSDHYQLNSSNELEFYVKMSLYDKFGILYGLDGQNEKSLYYLQYVIDRTKDKEIPRVYHNSIGNLSINQYRNGDYEASIKNALIDLESSLRLNRRFSITALGVLLSKNHLALNQPSKALKYIQMADTTSQLLNGIFQIDVLKLKAEYHQMTGELTVSNMYFQKYLARKDSISLNAIKEMEFRMQIEEDFYQKIRNFENEIVKNQAIIKSQKQRNLIASITLFTIVIFTVIFGFMLKNISKKNRLLKSQKDKIQRSNEVLQNQKEELESQNEIISDLNHTLEEKVKNRTNALEEKSKLIEAFLYQMSHRFRTPITNLKGLLNLISVEKNPDNIPQYLHLSFESIDKLDGILSHIRKLLELEIKDQEKEHFLLYDMISEIVDELTNRYHSGRLHILNHTVKSNSPEMYSVKEYHSVMFREILDNACKFSVLNNKNKQPLVEISERIDQKEYQLIIEDNGPGMTRQQWEDVFKPFFVGNEYSKGDGLGFYIASIAANKTACRIKLENHEEKGTRMIIHIPLQETPEDRKLKNNGQNIEVLNAKE